MDRKQFSDEEVQKRIEALPPEVSALLYSPEMLEIVKRVGAKQQLHIDQVGLLEAETGEVMLGFTSSKDYPEALMETLGVDRMKADAIAQDINDMLFVKIRDAMKKASANGDNSASAPQNPPAAEKSVVMPSAVKAAPPTPPAQSPVAKVESVPLPVVLASTPQTKPVTPAPAPAQAPMTPPAIPKVDVMLSQPTVSLPNPSVPPAAPTTAQPTPPPAKTEAPKPVPPYKADPYREPPE